MKRFTIIIVLLHIVNVLSSQIIIDKNDFFETGDKIPVIRYLAPDINGVNFSDLFGEPLIFDDIHWHTGSVDTIKFLEPSLIDIEGIHNQANCVHFSSEGLHRFLNISDTEISLVGIQRYDPTTDDEMNMIAQKTLSQYIFPISLGYEHSDTGVFDNREHISEFEDFIPPDYYDIVTFLYDTVKFEIIFNLISNFDEYGTMQLIGDYNLNGTFDYLKETNILITTVDILLRNRFNNTYTSIGELFEEAELPMIDTTSSYNYWTKNHKYPLVNLYMTNDFQNVLQVHYRFYDNTTLNNIYKADFFEIFPNPVKSNVYFYTENLNSGYIYIYSLSGILKEQIMINSNYTVYNTNHLNKGIYIYQITDNEDNYIKTGKILKN